MDFAFGICFASGVEPFCLFLRTSCGLLDCVEPFPMSLGVKFYSLLLTVLAFSLGFWSSCEFSSSPSIFLFIFTYPKYKVSLGVDNALIKGEIAEPWWSWCLGSTCDE